MEFARSKFFPVAFCLGLTCSLHTAGAANENDLVPPELVEWGRKFSGVKEWQGIWEVSIAGAASRSSPGGHMDSRYEAKAHGSFLLKRPPLGQPGWDPRAGVLTWRGEGEAIGGGQGVYSSRTANYGTGEEWEQRFQGSTMLRRIEFTLWFSRKGRNVNLQPGSQDQSSVPRMQRTGRSFRLSPDSSHTLTEHPIEHTSAAPIDTWFLGSSQADADRRWQVVANGPGVLVFSLEGPAAGRNQPFEVSGAGVHRRSRVLLFPVYDDIEVEVAIDGYADWRPKGTINDPGKPGGELTARATLRPKDGSSSDGRLPTVRHFRFELLDTSREPGICMNWPLGAEDDDPDLRLSTAGTGGELSREDQKLLVGYPPLDDRGQPYAEAKIESYDFGGRAELRVICELEDGREIVGLLKADSGGQDLIRLPKMKGPGWVAEVWRRTHGVPDLPDNDDEEKIEGQKHRGDGFTLYEEYRGFVVNGRHVSGDPAKKDFFILNLADVSTRDGIALFERLSKLRVHSRLRDGREMSQEKRVMNANRRDAPHRVAQHGVVLSHEGIGQGGGTIGVDGVDTAKAYRPRYVKWVHVERPDAMRGLFAAGTLPQYGLEHLDPKQLYAAAVAHELAHATGADHHGEWRMQARWAYFQGADNPMNPAGKVRFTDSWAPDPAYFQRDGKRTWSHADRGASLTLLWEDTQENLADERTEAFEAALEWARRNIATGSYVTDAAADLSRFGKGEDFWREYLAHIHAEGSFNFRMFVGRQQGTDSGDEACLMRYYFATAYEAKENKNTFYVIRPGAKTAPFGLCTSPAGTGGNAPSHSPQSRFGAAHGGRGNCFGEICPNDAIPPRGIVLQ